MDTSAILAFKQPDTMQNLSSLVNVARGAQSLQNESISLQERQALQKVLADKANFTDEQGNFDLGKAQQNIMSAAPTTGAKYWTEIANAHSSSVAATSALNKLTGENRSQIGGVLASLPRGATPELVHKTVDALDADYGGRLKPLVDVFKRGYAQAQKNGPDAADNFIHQSARSVLPQQAQQDMDTPAGVTLNNGQQSVMVNLKPGVAGTPQGGAVDGTAVQNLIPVGQQEGVTNDAQGNMHVLQRDKFGNVLGTRPLAGAAPTATGPFTLPPGETKESMAELQAQRAAAQQQANSAPVMHDINRTIIKEASKGINTGALGQLTQKLASATGYSFGSGESATDYNVLGKMLERSALTAAQSMGPHTNAGLEASIRANGSLEYTPAAIKKIAHLNDALVSGAELYRDGLEKAISSSPNHVFSKREFDSKWAKVATPQVLRLKNAVDNASKEEIADITKEVGGRGSKGAQKLHEQLTELLKLSGR